jgi:hypothetical protein
MGGTSPSSGSRLALGSVSDNLKCPGLGQDPVVNLFRCGNVSLGMTSAHVL